MFKEQMNGTAGGQTRESVARPGPPHGEPPPSHSRECGQGSQSSAQPPGHDLRAPRMTERMFVPSCALLLVCLEHTVLSRVQRMPPALALTLEAARGLDLQPWGQVLLTGGISRQSQGDAQTGPVPAKQHMSTPRGMTPGRASPTRHPWGAARTALGTGRERLPCGPKLAGGAKGALQTCSG